MVMFKGRDVHFKTISVPLTRARIDSKFICLAIVFINDVRKLTGIMTALLMKTMAAVSSLYR